MFVFSFKTTKKSLLIGIACLVAFLALTAAAIWWPDTEETVPTVAAAEPADHLSFLRSIGCEAAAAPMAVEEILLPDKADTPFETYNALQQQAGFDLSDYCGKRVKVFKTEFGGKTAAVPGTVVAAGKQGIEIACGDGTTLRIVQLQGEGGKRMDAADYLRGHSVQVGV